MSSSFSVTDSNRDDIQIRYVDSIISHMDFMDIRNRLREYLHAEKDQYTNEDLADEIKSRDSTICKEVFGRVYRPRQSEVEV